MSPELAPREARLCLSMGTNCLRSMAGALHIPYDRDPLPTAGIRLTRAEFDEGFRRLEDRGFPLERDADEAWRHFQGWRVNYEPIVDALTLLVVPPPAPWFLARPELGAAEWPRRAEPHARRARGLSVLRVQEDLQDAVGAGVEELVGPGGLAQAEVVGEGLGQGEAARLHQRDEGRPRARDRRRRSSAGSCS